jgi:hypothetical protein
MILITAEGSGASPGQADALDALSPLRDSEAAISDATDSSIMIEATHGTSAWGRPYLGIN